MIFQTFNRQNKMSPAFNHNFLLHWMPNLCEKTCTECRQEKVNVIKTTNVGSQTDYQSMDARGINLWKYYDKAPIYLSGLAISKLMKLQGFTVISSVYILSAILVMSYINYLIIRELFKRSDRHL